MMIMRSGEGRVELAGVGAEDRVQQLLPLGSKVQVAPPDSLPQGGGGQGGNILGLDHHMGEGEGEEVMEARASAFWRAAFLAAST